MARSLGIVVDASSGLDAIRAQLRNKFDFRFYSLDQIEQIGPEQNVVFDIDIAGCPDIPGIKQWLARRPQGGKVIFAVDKVSWHARAQAAALGAAALCDRPLEAGALFTILKGDFGALSDNPKPPLLRRFAQVRSALDALENIFLSAHIGTPLDFKVIDFAGKMLSETIAEDGVAAWINIVRTHHSQTYQHSLLVTGVIVAFGQQLGLSTVDQLRLSSAAMLHDIGKACVPVAILEKPRALDRGEMKQMRQHPERGYEALSSATNVTDDVRDMVLHHHEYLDGSGYPHHLMGSEISDLVRIVTISDIFSALIERRAYKKAMSCHAAYDILRGMGPKLDLDLCREFHFVTELKVS